MILLSSEQTRLFFFSIPAVFCFGLSHFVSCKFNVCSFGPSLRSVLFALFVYRTYYWLVSTSAIWNSFVSTLFCSPYIGILRFIRYSSLYPPWSFQLHCPYHEFQSFATVLRLQQMDLTEWRARSGLESNYQIFESVLPSIQDFLGCLIDPLNA